MKKWYEDEVVKNEGGEDYFRLSRFSSPAFRLSLQTSMIKNHPLDYVEEYGALFNVFKPILQRDAERLLMIDVAGKNPRRRKSIKDSDWEPFRYMKSKIPDDDRYFIGFDFQCGFGGKSDEPAPTGYHRYDVGPAKFFVNINTNVKLDASTPVHDYYTGFLDIVALKDALLKLPISTALSGFGFCVSDTFDWPAEGIYGFKPVAKKYPVVDFTRSRDRDWSIPDDNFDRAWHSGLNWLTLIGEPFLSALGGIDKLTDGLDSAITWEKGCDSVLFQLGERPISGEKDVDDDLLPLYFELGQRLQPIGDGCPSVKNPFHRVFGDSHQDEEVKYARRFYDKIWFEE